MEAIENEKLKKEQEWLKRRHMSMLAKREEEKRIEDNS